MQNTSNNDCVVLDGTPNHSSPIKLPVFKGTLSNNTSLSSLEEMETEDISTEIIPKSVSPLLLYNNKRQQISINKGLKRTCLEKAFSTMTTSSQNIDEQCCSDIQNQENVCPEYNSIKTNFISSCNVSEVIKNDLKPEPNGKILISPIEKHSVEITSKQFNNKIAKDFESRKNIPSHKSINVYPQKRNTSIMYGDSDESTEDDLYETEKKEKQRTNFNYKFKDRKSRRRYNKSINERKKHINYFESDDSSPNRLNSISVKERCSNITSCNNTLDFIELPSHSKQSQDISELPSTSTKTLRNKFRSSKVNQNKNSLSKVINKQTKEGNNDGDLSLCKNNKYEHKCGSSKNKNDNENYKHSLTSTSNRSEAVKFRRIQPRRGNIVKYPVEDTDSEIEFFDTKCDVTDISDTKRNSKTNSRKKGHRDWNSKSEYFLDDSCSDISIVSEKHYSPPNQNWRNTESPDPVEQVRQMEEDEKLAFRLQAQYDAEANLNNTTESEDFDFDSSFLSGLHMDNFSNSSDTSSSSTTTEGSFPFVLPFSPNLHRVTNNAFLYGVERTGDRRRSPRLQQSFMDWIPGRIRNVLTSLMPNFPEDDYEALLQLTENIGDECQGLKKQQVNSLPTRKFCNAQSTSKSTTSGNETSQECKDCTICLCEYQNNDLLRLLPCSHEFHANCIDRWLKSHRTCPICRIEVSVKRQYGKKRKT